MTEVASRHRRRALLRTILGEQRRRLSVASGLFTLHQIGEVLVPVVAGATIDRAIVTADLASVVRWLVVLAVVFAVLSNSWRWADRLLTAAVEEAAHRLRLRLTGRFIDHEGVADAPAAGEVVSVASNDVIAAARVLVAVAAGAASVAALVVSALILLVLSRPLGLVVLVGLPVAVVALQLLTRPLERRLDHQRGEAARAAALATDLLTGLRVLKGLRAEAASSDRYRTASQRALMAGLRASRFGAVHDGGIVLTTGAFVAVVALMAGRLAADGRMSVGAMVAAIGVTQFLVGPLGRLGFAGGELAAARASAGRAATMLDTTAAVADGSLRPAEGPGAIALRSVGHRTLRDIDLEIGAGSFVAVAALDAPDAVALVELLARRRDPAVGSLEVDGNRFPSLSLDRLRRMVMVSRHDATLFSGSVLENITAVAPELAQDRDGLDRILEAVGAGELAHSLVDGVDTPVTARGMSLSGGQRQRIALARALAGDPPVLVLHDPTTAIDPVTESIAAAGLRARRAGRTTIAVTTSPALLAVADEVVVLDGGALVDRGTHHALVARNPAYASAVLS